MSRSLNKATLIGNLTRDPELRYTPQGTAVCSFGLATNRQWTTDSGDKKEDVEFHRIVAWNKLAELCAQLLSKGRKVFVEGRLQTRRWQTQEGQDRMTTEVVINDMIILDSRGDLTDQGGGFDIPDEELEKLSGDEETFTEQDEKEKKVKGKKEEKSKKKVSKKDKEEEDDDIPF